MAQPKSKEAAHISSAAVENTGAWGLSTLIAMLAVLLLVMFSGRFSDLSCDLLAYLPILVLAAIFLAPIWYLVYRMLAILSDATTTIRSVRNGSPTTVHRDIQRLRRQIRNVRKVRIGHLHSFNSSSQWLQQLPKPLRVEIAVSLTKRAAAEREIKGESNQQLVFRRIMELEGNQKYDGQAEAQKEKAESNVERCEEMLAECKEHGRRTQKALDESRKHCRQAEIRAAVAEAINLEKDKTAAEKDKLNDYLQNHNKSLKAEVHCHTKIMCGQKQEAKGCPTECHTTVAVPSNETTILESDCKSKITQLKAEHVTERDALERSHVNSQIAQTWTYERALQTKEVGFEERYAAKFEADKHDLEQKCEKRVEVVTQSFRRREDEERRVAKAFFKKEAEEDATKYLANIHDLEDQVIRLQREKIDAETESKAKDANLETTSSDQKERITGLESKLAQAMQDLVEARADARKQGTEAGANATKVERLEKEVRRLKDDNARREVENKAEVNNLQDALETQQKTIEDTQEALRQANASNETLPSSQAEQSAHDEHLQREVSRLEQAVVNCDAAHHLETQDAQRKISELESSLQAADQEFRHMRNDRDLLGDKLSDANKGIESSRGTFWQQNNERNAMRTENSNLGSQLAEERQNTSRLETQVEKEQQKHSELAARLDVARGNATTLASGLQEQLADKTLENSVLQDKVKALEEELRNMKENAKASPLVSSNSTQTPAPAPSPALSPCERLCIESGVHSRDLAAAKLSRGLSATASIATHIETSVAAPKLTLPSESVEAAVKPQQNTTSTVTKAHDTNAGDGASPQHDTSEQSETTAPAQRMLTLSATPVEKKPARSTGDDTTQWVRCRHCKSPIRKSARVSHLKVCPEKKAKDSAVSAKLLTVKDATWQAKSSNIEESKERRESSPSAGTVIQVTAAPLSQPRSALATSSLGTQLSATQHTTASLVAVATQNISSNAASSTVEKTHEVLALASPKEEINQVEVSEQTRWTAVSHEDNVSPTVVSPIPGTTPPIQPSTHREPSAEPRARSESRIDELFEGSLSGDEEGNNLIDYGQFNTSTAAADPVGQGTQDLTASFGDNAQLAQSLQNNADEPTEMGQTIEQRPEQNKGKSRHPKIPLASESLAPTILPAVTDMSANRSDQPMDRAPALLSYEPSPEVNMQAQPMEMTLSIDLSAQPTTSSAAQPFALIDTAVIVDEPLGRHDRPMGIAPASDAAEQLSNLMSTMALRDTTDDQPMRMDEPVNITAPPSEPAPFQSTAGNTAPAMSSTFATLTQGQDSLATNSFNIYGIMQGVEVPNPFLQPSEPSQDVDVQPNPNFWQTLQIPSQVPAVPGPFAQAPSEETFLAALDRNPDLARVMQQIARTTPALVTDPSVPSSPTLETTNMFSNPHHSAHIFADYLHVTPQKIQTSAQFLTLPTQEAANNRIDPDLPEIETGYQDDEPHDFYADSPIITHRPFNKVPSQTSLPLQPTPRNATAGPAVDNPAHGISERVAFDEEESTEDEGLEVCEEKKSHVPRQYRPKFPLRARHATVAAYPVANLEQYAPIPPSLTAQGPLQVVLTDEGQVEDTQRPVGGGEERTPRPQRARTDEDGEFSPGQDREIQQLPLFNYPPDVVLPGLNPWQEAAGNYERPEDGEAFNDPDLFVAGHEDLLREQRYDIWETMKASQAADEDEDEDGGDDGLCWETVPLAANDPANPFYTPGDHAMQAQIDQQVHEENITFYGDDYMARLTASSAKTASTTHTRKRACNDDALRTTPLSPPQS
ncbi:MAG: hypothetical protein Q9181_001948, partial [Wetmoreana brouardii]